MKRVSGAKQLLGIVVCGLRKVTLTLSPVVRSIWPLLSISTFGLGSVAVGGGAKIFSFQRLMSLAVILCAMAVPFRASAQVTLGTYPSPAEALAACKAFIAAQPNGPGDDACGLGNSGMSVTNPTGGYVVDGHCCGAGNEAGWNTALPAPLGTPRKTMGPPCPCAGDPINLATGNEYHDEDDADLGALSFHRYYNSQIDVTPANIGGNWRHSFDRSLAYASTGGVTTATIYRPNGQWVIFTENGAAWTTDPDVPDSLTSSTDGSGNITGWTYFDAATRNHENYNAAGQLVSIQDPNQLTTTLTYSTSSTPASVAPVPGLLLSVVDPRGRQLSFVYQSNSLVSTVTLPDSGVLTYSYSGTGNLLTNVTYPDKSTRQYVYQSTSGTPVPRTLTGFVDEVGVQYITLGYNSQGLATSSQLAGTVPVDLTSVTYNGNGTSTVTYPLGAQTTLSFVTPNGSVHTSAVSTPCGPTCGQPNAAATFDSNGYPASTTDFNGNVTATTYDVNGLLDQQIDASGTSNQRTTNLTWNTTLRVPLTRTVLDVNGNTVSNTQWVYNSLGEPLARCQIDPTNSAATGYVCSNTGTVPSGVRRWTYTYCTAVGTGCPIVGLMLTATGPRTDLTQTTTYSYYTTSSATNCGTPGAACYQPGDLYQVTDALGHVTTIASYDADGRITRITDPNGVNTDTTYTPRGWVYTRTVGGAETIFGYTAYGAVQTITDSDGVTTTFGYDSAHRLNKITDALGNYIQYTLDAAGNKTAEQVYDSTGALHKSLSRTFNTLGQLIGVIDGLNHTVFSATYSDSYDANGNLVHSADALGIQQHLGYDALNRLTQTINDYNGTDGLTPNTTTGVAYDALDRTTGVTDPSSLNTTYQYDGLSD
jgi:YD repeat-containing protein